MIDGRIVEAGDEVSGARVVEIGPTSVTLRDQAGARQAVVDWVEWPLDGRAWYLRRDQPLLLVVR